MINTSYFRFSCDHIFPSAILWLSLLSLLFAPTQKCCSTPCVCAAARVLWVCIRVLVLEETDVQFNWCLKILNNRNLFDESYFAEWRQNWAHRNVTKMCDNRCDKMGYVRACLHLIIFLRALSPSSALPPIFSCMLCCFHCHFVAFGDFWRYLCAPICTFHSILPSTHPRAHTKTHFSTSENAHTQHVQIHSDAEHINYVFMLFLVVSFKINIWCAYLLSPVELTARWHNKPSTSKSSK